MKDLIHRDEVHGDIRFDGLSVALLNTPTLQRLGRIYQLGYSHLVYRGGNHTRLSHVMGAYHVAARLVDSLAKNYSRPEPLWPEGAVEPDLFLPAVPTWTIEERRSYLDARWRVLRYLVSWAALLHDVGHVPVGHTLEDEFKGIYEKHDDFTSRRMMHLWGERAPGEHAYIREVFSNSDLYPEEFRAVFPHPPDLGATSVDGEKVWQTVMLICLYKGSLKSPDKFRKSLAESRKELATDSGDVDGRLRFIDLVEESLTQTEGSVFFPYMADIVGNTICADYLDYLQRDPRNLGLDVLRDDRIISQFWIGRPLIFPKVDGARPASAPPIPEPNNLHMALALVDRRGKPRLDTTTGVVELVRQRYRFAEIVYYHKTKASASAMLAKVFFLTGPPAEVRSVPPELSILDVEQHVERLFKWSKEKRTARTAEMIAQYTPSALLDPEVGDDSMHILLQNRAWEIFRAATGSPGNKEEAKRALRAASLLQALGTRQLYKVTFSISRALHRVLIPGAKLPSVVQERLRETITELREGKDGRAGAELQASLQHEMETAAGFPPDSILLYIPPLLSQAKGIETGALDRDGDVITLGEHTAVEEDVRELRRKYEDLWKLIVFVHPGLATRNLDLSAAVDALLRRLFVSDPARSEKFLTRHARDIQAASWFDYVPVVQRPAARAYAGLREQASVDWPAFSERWRAAVSGAADAEEIAYQVYLDGELRDKPRAAQLARQRFPTAAALGQHIRAMREERRRAASSGLTFSGETRSALDEVVANLTLEAERNVLFEVQQPELLFDPETRR